MTKARWWLLGSALLGSLLFFAALLWRLPEAVHAFVLSSLVILIASLQFIGGIATARHLHGLDGGSRVILLTVSSISALCWLLVLGFGSLMVSLDVPGSGFAVALVYVVPMLILALICQAVAFIGFIGSSFGANARPPEA